MATPQWMLVHKRLLPLEKEVEDHFERNARRRHRQAVQSALRKGFLKALDQDLILQSQGDGSEENTKELDQVLRISVRAVQILDDLAILACSRLLVCNLTEGYLTDISAFRSCTNLLKLDVSENQIGTLPGTAFWSSLSNLRILYLHGNQLSRTECLLSLGGCPQLHILTSYDTPLSLDPSYRHVAVNCIYSLKVLDHYVISDEEVIENLRLPQRFKARTRNFRIHPYQSPPKGVSCREELQGVFQLLLEVTHKLAHHSPVLIIQRYVRGWLTRRMLAKSSSDHARASVNGGRCTARAISADNVTNILRRVAKRNKPPSPSISSLSASTGGPPLRHSCSRQSRSARKKARTIGDSLSVTHLLPPPPPSSPVHQLLSSSLSPSLHKTGSPRYRFPPLSNSWNGTEKLHGGKGGGIRVEIKFSKYSPETKDKRRLKRKGTTGVPAITGDQGAAPVTSGDQGATAVTSGQNTRSTAMDPGKEGDRGTLCITGDTARVMQFDRVAEKLLARKEDGRWLREAKRQIKQRVAELKQPLKIDRSRVKPAVTKDTHSFDRAHTTVSLAALKTLDRAHRARQRASDRAVKIRQVAQAKLEREERKDKVIEHQQMVREAVLAWRASEELRLEQERAKQARRLEEELEDKAIALEAAAEREEKRQADEKFASEFCQHNTMVGNALLKEDRRMILEAEAEQAKRQLEEAREVAAERQEIVKRYMKMREEQMKRDASAARQELNARVIQVTSQRLLEAKQKVAREVARRQVAKAAMEAISPGDFRTRDHNLSYDLPNTNLLEALSEDIPDLSCGGAGAVNESRDSRTLISVHMRRLSRESRRTWQRGSMVLVDGQLTSIHPFPHPHKYRHHSKAGSSTVTPLAYNNLHPLPHLHNLHTTTPDESDPSSSSLNNTREWLSTPKWPPGVQTNMQNRKTVV